jgi:hypothetical protein
MMKDERDYWLTVRRSILQLVRDLTRMRPDGRYTLDVTIRERTTSVD